MQKVISIEQAFEWEISKMGIIKTELFKIKFFHKRFCNRMFKRYKRYLSDKVGWEQEIALRQAKQLIK